jgi:hypothetical protein
MGIMVAMLQRNARRSGAGAIAYLAANALLALQEPFFHVMQRLAEFDVSTIKQLLGQ